MGQEEANKPCAESAQGMNGKDERKSKQGNRKLPQILRKFQEEGEGRQTLRQFGGGSKTRAGSA